MRLVLESRRPIAHVVQDLGVREEALRQWVRQAEADAGTRHDRLTTSERERLKHLERENRELKKANEILKAVSVFSPGDRRGPAEVSAFIDEPRDARLAVDLVCRTLGVSSSAYYARCNGPPSRRPSRTSGY